jgi:hypothetical protein
MGGEGEVIEIDECLLRGKRKNNKGRYTAGDLEELQAKRRKRARRGIIPIHRILKDSQNNVSLKTLKPWRRRRRRNNSTIT